MEIEVGEYVRTKNGQIAKYIKKEECDEDVFDGILFDNCIYKDNTRIRKGFLKTIIVKHSKNIIDLIEVGDYVNGCRVEGFRVDRDNFNKVFGVYSSDNTVVDEENIKSIVTKEQMASVEYKVEEDK